ncbi:MAG: MFS transporter [Chloroflexi bacterium]|nr:MFS transporter [Chloroflexota bacterium]
MERPPPTIAAAIPRLWPFKRAFYGWAVVAASSAAVFSQVPMYGPVISVFVKPIGDELGWSRGEIALAFTTGTLVGLALSGLVGKQLDRYGARAAVVVAGMIVAGVLVGLAFMQEVWQFWLLFGSGRAAALAGINLGTSVAVVNWFVRRRGRAVGFLSMSLRGGQALFPLLIVAIIAGYSWRHAFGVLAVISLVFVVTPAWLFLRRRPEDMGLLPDGDPPPPERAPDGPAAAAGRRAPSRARPDEVSWTLAEARRTRAFWLLVVATMSVVFAQTAVNLHAVASFQDRGIADAFAGIFVFVYAGTAAVSSVPFGMLADRIHIRWVLVLGTLFFCASIAVLIAADSVPAALLFAVLYGLGAGGWTIGYSLLFANYFGRGHVGAVRGFSQVVSSPVGAVGPLLAGYLHGVTGDYTLSFQIMLGSFAVVLVALLLAKPPRQQGPAA